MEERVRIEDPVGYFLGQGIELVPLMPEARVRLAGNIESIRRLKDLEEYRKRGVTAFGFLPILNNMIVVEISRGWYRGFKDIIKRKRICLNFDPDNPPVVAITKQKFTSLYFRYLCSGAVDLPPNRILAPGIRILTAALVTVPGSDGQEARLYGEFDSLPDFPIRLCR